MDGAPIIALVLFFVVVIGADYGLSGAGIFKLPRKEGHAFYFNLMLYGVHPHPTVAAFYAISQKIAVSSQAWVGPAQPQAGNSLRWKWIPFCLLQFAFTISFHIIFPAFTIEHTPVQWVTGDEVRTLEGRQPGGKSDRECWKDNVERDREGELDAREQNGIHFHLREFPAICLRLRGPDPGLG